MAEEGKDVAARLSNPPCSLLFILHTFILACVMTSVLDGRFISLY